MHTFDAFGQDVIVCWPGTTSEQAGGERAGKTVQFEQADVDDIRAGRDRREADVPRDREVSRPLARGAIRQHSDPRRLRRIRRDPQRGSERGALAERRGRREAAARGVPRRDAREEALRRNARGRRDGADRRRAFHRGRHDGPQDAGEQLLHERRRVGLDSVLDGGRLWDTSSASVLVFTPCPGVRSAGAAAGARHLAERQHFSPTDKRAIRMFGMAEFRPINEGITIGLEVLLLFIGLLTLGHRRRRRDEHHARLRERAHARDRPAPGAGRAAAAHPRAVPGRGAGADAGRRRDRRGAFRWHRRAHWHAAVSGSGVRGHIRAVDIHMHVSWEILVASVGRAGHGRRAERAWFPRCAPRGSIRSKRFDTSSTDHQAQRGALLFVQQGIQVRHHFGAGPILRADDFAVDAAVAVDDVGSGIIDGAVVRSIFFEGSRKVGKLTW